MLVATKLPLGSHMTEPRSFPQLVYTTTTAGGSKSGLLHDLAFPARSSDRAKSARCSHPRRACARSSTRRWYRRVARTLGLYCARKYAGRGGDGPHWLPQKGRPSLICAGKGGRGAPVSLVDGLWAGSEARGGEVGHWDNHLHCLTWSSTLKEHLQAAKR